MRIPAVRTLALVTLLAPLVLAALAASAEARGGRTWPGTGVGGGGDAPTPPV